MKLIEIFVVVSIFFAVFALGAISVSTSNNEKFAELASYPITRGDMHNYAKTLGQDFIPKSERFLDGVNTINDICCSFDSKRYQEFNDAGVPPHLNLETFFSDMPTDDAIESLKPK
jgi:hypothetical protein